MNFFLSISLVARFMKLSTSNELISTCQKHVFPHKKRLLVTDRLSFTDFLNTQQSTPYTHQIIGDYWRYFGTGASCIQHETNWEEKVQFGGSILQAT
jgi:hypothetical protein